MTPSTLESLCKLLPQSTLLVMHQRRRGAHASAFGNSMPGLECDVPGQVLLFLSSGLHRPP